MGTLGVVSQCLDLYQTHCMKGERFGEILERLGPETKNDILCQPVQIQAGDQENLSKGR